MKKNTSARKITLSRETLLRLDSAQVEAAQGGASMPIRTCEPTSNCTATTGCTVTACGHC